MLIFFPENSNLCPENLILPLAIGSTSSVTTAWHEEKHSPELAAESPQLMVKPCSKPALKIIKGQACNPWHFGLGLERGSITHWPSPVPLKPRGWLALGSAWVTEEAELELNSGGHWGARWLPAEWNCSCACCANALAEPLVLVNELTAEKLEVCLHHIFPFTLHPILFPWGLH